MKRRDLIKLGIATGLAGGLSRLAAGAALYGPMPEKPMRVLILGGTGFIGPHMVRAFIAQGHTVTLFNRGKSNPELFPNVETLIGDRDGDLAALENRRWDAVVDTSGYLPRLVGDSARLLADATDHYLFISTISVYAGFEEMYLDENAALLTMEDPSNENINEFYGALKVLCEEVVEETYPGRATILRPGLIAGPGDHTDRVSYWPVRVSRGGDMLIPGDGSDYMQWVDVRDLADFVVRCLERRITGIYNAVRPGASYTVGDMVADSAVISGVRNFKPVYVPLEFLESQGVEVTWGQPVPAYVPTGRPSENQFVFTVSSAAGFAKGLRGRPASETIADILGWWDTLPAERTAALRAGISPEKEAAVITAWQDDQAKG